MFWNRYIFAFISCLGWWTVCSQVPQLSYRQLTVKDGLAQQQVQCIFEDSRGFLWIGTKQGISRFDGKNFVNYKKKDGLPSEFVGAITEDSKGNIWFRAGEKHLLQFDGIKFNVFGLDTLVMGTSSALVIDKQDRLYVWAQNQNREQKILKFDQGKFEVLIDAKSFGCSQLRINGLNYAAERLYFFGYEGTSYKLAYYENDEVKIIPTDLFSLNQFYQINEENYITGKTNKKASYALFRITEKQQLQFITDNLKGYRSFFDWKGNLWNYKNYDDTLRVYAQSNFDNISIAFDKPGISINNAIQAKDRTIWLGTEEGLIHFASLGFHEFDGDILPNIWTIVEDTISSNLYFGGYKKGLYRWDGQKVLPIEQFLSDENLTILSREGRKAFPSRGFYMGATRSQDGSLLFPLTGGILGLKNNQFFHFNKDTSRTRSTALFLYEDKTRNLILSGEGGGARVYDKQGHLVRYISRKQGLHKSSFVLSIAQDKDGYFWLGSGGGLSRYDYERDTVIKNYLHQADFSDRAGVVSITKDFKHTLWFGTSNGIRYYDQQKDTLVRIATEIDGVIGFVYPMENTHLLIGAGDGLYALDLQKFHQSGTVRYKNFNYHNGFNGIECGQNGIIKSSKGNYWLTTSDKVIRMSPKYLNFSNEIGLQSIITEVNGVAQSFVRDSLSTIKIKDKTTIINFIAVGNNRPQETSYTYRLVKNKVATAWSPWQKEQYAILTDLEDGEYEFELKAGLANQEKKDLNTAKIRLQVDIAFYKEALFPWYIFTLGLLSALGIYLFHKRKNQQLQNEAERNKQQAEYLQIQALQAQLNPHFLNNALSSLGNFVLKNEKVEAYDRITKLGKLMRGYMEASVSSSLKGALASDVASLIPLRKIVELLEKYIIMESLQFEEGIDFHLDCSEELMDIHFIPPFIIQPYVENAIIHGLRDLKTVKRQLYIRFWETADTLVCTVEDNGIGLQAAKKKQQSALQRRVSYGTNLVKRRIAMLNKHHPFISTDLRERKESGTIAIITFKLQE